MNLFFILLLIIIILALLEAPLFTIISGLSMLFLFFVDFDTQSIQLIIIEMNRLASMPVLVALPLFTFVGCLLTATSAPKRIMRIMNAFMGWLPGGLAIAGLCSCAFFTALTGASGVTIVALGSVLYPILKKNRYDEKFTLGLLTTSGSLGLLFPPSLPVILYGVVAGVDISKIFKAALIPGILLIIALSLYAIFRNRYSTGTKQKEREPLKKNPSKQTLGKAIKEGIWDWPVLIIIIGGVYGGLVTIAEVSAIVVLYVVVTECFILKEINLFRDIPKIIIESTILSGAIIIILSVALGFTGYLVDEQIPTKLLKFLSSFTDNKFVFLAGLNILLLAVGCIMDIFSAIIIIVPIMVPIAIEYGVDPIHLCIIFLVNLEIGYSTPPVGINLFIASLKFERPVSLLYRATLPYLMVLLIVLLLITYVPILSLFLIQ